MSSDQPTRSTRSAMENNISSLPNKQGPAKIDESVQLQGMKRRADINLTKQHHGVKRFALGNLTNAESDNLTSQQASKVSIQTAKANPSNDSKVAGSKSKGMTKMLTRAAMRLARNVKKLQDKQDDLEDCNRNEIVQSSCLTEDFAKVNFGVGAGQKPDITQATGEKDNSKMCTAKKQQKNFSHVPGVCRSEKNSTVSVTEDVMPQTRSNDFELSDNSLYVTAIESHEEENNLFTDNTVEKATGKGEKPEGPMKKQALKLQVKTKNGSAPMNVKNLPPRVSNNNEGKKNLGETSNVKITDFELSDNALYVSAFDTLGEEASSSSEHATALLASEQEKLIPGSQLKAEHKRLQNEELVQKSTDIVPRPNSTTGNDVKEGCDTDHPQSPPKRTPQGVEDFDKANWNDVNQVSEYAQDIFDYLRERESVYLLKDYMKGQPHLTCYMRALLVDWMVEVQESFELNHETLYLAVKIVDAYLSLAVIERNTLQLVATAGLLIAAKYDERVPPTVDDFIYICDGAYHRDELLEMERTVFRTLGFDIGFPLSYRFLRRYARVTRVPMHILTLARYILETSLMDYATVVLADSKLACASLFIALRMYDQPGWNKGLEFYSGYKVDDFKDIVILLNNGIWPRKSPLYKLVNVREKYSHDLFFQVAKRPVITTLAKLFDSTNVIFKNPAAPSAMTQSTSSEDNKTDAPETSGIIGTVASSQPKPRIQ
uniref:Uncharacterized protein n=1 Tax=Anopheles atroparvus TaxID=41427 RepID=A0A182IPU0_ANOAO